MHASPEMAVLNQWNGGMDISHFLMDEGIREASLGHSISYEFFLCFL